jgi:energy-coupling factor transport system ATP-binding protein
MISVKNLSYWYPDAEKPALDNVNLEIFEGEFVLILGASGSGKSTLLYALNGILEHEIGGKIRGHIEVCGKNPITSRVCDMATAISLVMQDPEAQLTQMNVWDEVVFGPENLLRPVEEIVQQAERALKFVGLYDKRDCLVTELSGGEKQRLAIAAALAMNTPIIALDEPTAHLDPMGTKDVFNVIKNLKNIGKTVLLVEHKVDDLLDIIEEDDRVIVIDSGAIALDGTVHEIFNSHARDIERLGLHLPQVVEVSTRLGIHPVPLRMDQINIPALPVQLHNPEWERKVYDPIIEVENLDFSYENGVQVLKNISLKIPRNSITALVGHNGSGKSTLLLNLIGLLKPVRGKILYEGKDISSLNLKEVLREIGYVFQYPEHQFVTKTVKDEIEYGLRVRNVNELEREKRVRDMLQMFGLEKMVNRHPFTLSMGEKRRLSFATMLVLKPKILIMDEPVVGQDRRNTEYLIWLMNKLRDEGTTIVVATHDMNFLAKCADYVIVLNRGEIMFQGDPIELFNNRNLLEAACLDDPPVHKIASKLGYTKIVTVEQFCSSLIEKKVVR